MAAEPEVDSINFWAARVRQLETDIVEERQKVLQAPPCGAFFVFFNNQRDAAIAAQVNLHPEDGHTFRVQEAPGPEEVRPYTMGKYHESTSQTHANWMATPSVFRRLQGLRR